MTELKSAQKPTDLQRADYARTIWQVNVGQNLAAEDLLDPRFWAHVARKIKPGDHIEAAPEYDEWWAEYRVLEVGDNWARLGLLRQYDLRKPESVSQPVSMMSSDDFEVLHRGAGVYSVRRKSDKSVIKNSCKSREEAEQFLVAHLKAMAA